MDYQRFYERFLEAIALKYPLKSGSAKDISQHLGLAPKSLARRMRGETPFTMKEIIKICTFLDISVDSLMAGPDQTVNPMKIYLRNLSKRTLPQDFRNLLSGMEYTARDGENGKVFSCNNFIPNGFYTAYPAIVKFIYFIWTYRHNMLEDKAVDLFSLSEATSVHLTQYAENSRKVKHSTYLFVADFMENVSKYILFYHEIELLTPEFASALCKELSDLLDEMEHIAIRGTWPVTDNKVDVYVTQLSIPNSLTITESKYYSAAVIYAFYINPIVTYHPATIEQLRNHAYSLVARSENISGSGEKMRIKFFKNQRETLHRLHQGLNLL